MQGKLKHPPQFNAAGALVDSSVTRDFMSMEKHAHFSPQ